MENHRSHRLDLSQDLVGRAQNCANRQCGYTLTFRALVREAVARELPMVVSLLKAAGITNHPSGQAKPREVDDVTWNLLELATDEVAIDKVELIRACLERYCRTV